MSLFPRRTPEGCSPPIDGCTCSCHRFPGTKHCVPCCGPGSGRTRVLRRIQDVCLEDLAATPDAELLAEAAAEGADLVALKQGMLEHAAQVIADQNKE